MKKILKKVFFLPPVPTLLISIPSYGFVIYTLTGENVNPVAAYVSYFLSAYALIITVAGITGIIRLVRQGIDKHPLVRRAMYAFYATITAVYNVIKFRRYGSPVMSAAKVINLTAALVSMLSLETAMLTQFGAAGDPEFRKMMTASTGAGISILVLGMAVYMIVWSTRQLKRDEPKKEA